MKDKRRYVYEKIRIRKTLESKEKNRCRELRYEMKQTWRRDEMKRKAKE